MTRRLRIFLTTTIPIAFAIATCDWTGSAKAAQAVMPTALVDGQPGRTGLSKWPIDKQNPESSIPSKNERDSNPLEFGYLLMDISDLAEAAVRNGKHLDAVRYFKALAKAVPDKAVSFRKLCESFEALADWQNALANCAVALTLDGVVLEDFERYVHIALDMKPTFGATDGEELDRIAHHLQTQIPNSTLADEIICKTGLRLRDNRRLQQCTDRLTASAPNSPKTLTYRWAFALQRGDEPTARRVIDEAKGRAISPAVVKAMVDGTATFSRLARWQWLRSWSGLLLVTLLVLATATGVILRRRVSLPQVRPRL